MRSARSEGAQRGVEFGQLPQIEHTASETLIRIVHRFARGHDKDAQVGIGGLLSSALDDDEPNIENSKPAALYYTLGGDQVQNWEYIPFYLK